MSVTVHMFVPGSWHPSDLLRPDADGGTLRQVVEPRLLLDFGCVAVTAFARHDRPVWSRILDEHFDIDWPPSVSSSAAVLAQVADRWFAVTFGQGRHLLRQDRLVPDFGLRVTANTVPPDRMRSISSIRLDATARRTAQGVSVPSSLGAFSVDLHGEWVRSLGGWTDDHLSRGMTGSQSLSVDLGPQRLVLAQLHELLKHLLDRYRSEDYRAEFGFIDLVVPVHADDPLVAGLDARVAALLRTDGREIGIVAPDAQPGDPAPHSYVLRRRGARRTRQLDRLGLRGALREVDDPLSLVVDALDGEGHRIGRSRPLREHLGGEIEVDGTCFVLAEGNWFRADAERLAELDRDLARIPELDARRLDMPRWFRGDDEEAYNRFAARERGWCLLDRKLFLGPDRRRDRLEICDLLTPQLDLICVKRLTSAGGLSHLFGQGSVSALAYRADPAYRDTVHEAFCARWPDAPMRPPTIVCAIGTDRDGPLRRTLPLFSRINLRGHAATVRQAGVGVAVTRVVSTSFRQRPSAAVAEHRDGRDGQLELFDR